MKAMDLKTKKFCHKFCGLHQNFNIAGVSVGFGRGGTSSNSGGTSNLRRGVWGPLKAPSGSRAMPW